MGGGWCEWLRPGVLPTYLIPPPLPINLSLHIMKREGSDGAISGRSMYYLPFRPCRAAFLHDNPHTEEGSSSCLRRLCERSRRERLLLHLELTLVLSTSLSIKPLTEAFHLYLIETTQSELCSTYTYKKINPLHIKDFLVLALFGCTLKPKRYFI